MGVMQVVHLYSRRETAREEKQARTSKCSSHYSRSQNAGGGSEWEKSKDAR